MNYNNKTIAINSNYKKLVMNCNNTLVMTNNNKLAMNDDKCSMNK